MTAITGCVRNTAPAGTWKLTVEDQDNEIVFKAVPEAELRKIIQAVVNGLGAQHAVYGPVNHWLAAYPAAPAAPAAPEPNP